MFILTYPTLLNSDTKVYRLVHYITIEETYREVRIEVSEAKEL